MFDIRQTVAGTFRPGFDFSETTAPIAGAIETSTPWATSVNRMTGMPWSKVRSAYRF